MPISSSSAIDAMWVSSPIASETMSSLGRRLLVMPKYGTSVSLMDNPTKIGRMGFQLVPRKLGTSVAAVRDNALRQTTFATANVWGDPVRGAAAHRRWSAR